MKNMRGVWGPLNLFVVCWFLFVLSQQRLVPKSAIFGDIWKAENKNHSSSRRSIPLNQV